MYLNLNNQCVFEGRLVKEVEYSTINGKNGAVPKVKFTIAVDKVMTKQQRDYAKNNNQPTSDFVPCECIGPKADFINNYFKKGSAIKLVAAFRSYSYDAQDGTKKYAYSFDVVDAGFVTADYSDANGNGNNNGAGNNNGGNNNGGNKSNQNFNDFAPVDDGDLPF